MTEQRCLVLGGRGFIGSHLSDTLASAGYLVRCFDLSPTPTPSSVQALDNLLHMQGDMASDDDLDSALHNCDVIFHLVSSTLPQTSNANPVFDIESNLVRTVRLLDLAVQHRVKKIIFSSSGGTVYGVPNHVPITEQHSTEPTCSYGIAKLAIEKYLALYQQLHGLEYCVLRIANPFGERQRIDAAQGAVAVFLGKVLRGERVDIWGDGSVVRDYLHISDVVRAFVMAMRISGPDRLFNIGSGHGQSINQVLDAIEAVTGRAAVRRYHPARNFDVPTNILDISRARLVLGWLPETSFLQGLQKFNAWVQSTQSG